MEMLRSRSYILQELLNEDFIDNVNCVDQNDECADDTCSIDLLYLKQIYNFLEDSANSNQVFDTPLIVVDNSTCSNPINTNLTRICSGTAPYLSPRGPVTPEEYLADNNLQNQGWSGGDGSFAPGKVNAVYKIFYDVMWSWGQSRTHCQNIGADLASIRSPEENEVIYNLNLNDKFRGPLWLGAKDNGNGIGNVNVWNWLDGDALSYTNFGVSPHADSTHGLNYGHCLEINRNGMWNDNRPCGGFDNVGFVCELRFNEN